MSGSATSSLEQLIQALRVLPGVGPKSASRIAYHLLQQDRAGARQLVDALDKALAALRHCQLCNTLCEDMLCSRCASDDRDRSVVCVVEMPADLAMVEQTHTFNGLYYVLMGASRLWMEWAPGNCVSSVCWSECLMAWCRRLSWQPISPTKGRPPLMRYSNCYPP